jgi:hypothetical protein
VLGQCLSKCISKLSIGMYVGINEARENEIMFMWVACKMQHILTLMALSSRKKVMTT